MPGLIGRGSLLTPLSRTNWLSRFGFCLSRNTADPRPKVIIPWTPGRLARSFGNSPSAMLAIRSWYFVAGTIIFPFVRDFYATQTLPPFGQLVILQLLVRGPILVGLCL